MYFNRNKNLVTLSNSILKAYGIRPFHNTIKVVDELFNKNQIPKRKLAVFLLDGFGTYIQKIYKKDIPNLYNHNFLKMTSIYPPTTVACTTAFLTGKYPVETGWLGWVEKLPMYSSPVTMFSSTFVDTKFETKVKTRNFLPTTDLIELINNKTNFTANKLMSFNMSLPNDLSLFFSEANKSVKKYDFSYLYLTEPDSTLHECGTHSTKVKNIVKSIDTYLDCFVKNNPDVLTLVIADHGHIDTSYFILNEHQELYSLLVPKYNCLEARSCMLFVKKGRQEEALKLIKKYYSDYFDIYTKEEIIEKHLFGYGKPNIHFNDLLGDFLLVSKSNAGIADSCSSLLVSHHAGGTKKELNINLNVFNSL